jgi:hypothetical protein
MNETTKSLFFKSISRLIKKKTEILAQVVEFWGKKKMV